MAPVAVDSYTSIPSLHETPSKKAANGIENMSLSTPSKPVIEKLVFSVKDVEKKEEPKVIDADSMDELRKRFVGDVTLDEKDEPLLKESRRRFVLFPIQYKEVSFHI